MGRFLQEEKPKQAAFKASAPYFSEQAREEGIYFFSRFSCYYVAFLLRQTIYLLSITKTVPFHLHPLFQKPFQFSLLPFAKPHSPYQSGKSSVIGIIFQNHNLIWLVLLQFLILVTNILCLSNKPLLLRLARQSSKEANHSVQ